jgi:malonyl-CoA/methylmalonyl-CoA synthetase
MRAVAGQQPGAAARFRHEGGILRNDREMTDEPRPSWAAHLPAGLTPAEVDLLAATSLPAAWAANWRAEPDRPVIIGMGEAPLTGADLHRQSTAVAGRLAAAGVRAGDPVLMSCATSRDLVIAHIAVLRMGAVALPANPAYREPELHHLINDAEPVAAIIDDAERRSWATSPELGHRPAVVVGPDIDLDDAAPPPLDRMAPGDPALIGYTSGTTGAPKGALLSHGNLLAGAEALRLAWRWTADDRLVLALPLFHMHGLGVGLHGTLLTGASVVLLPRFEVDEVIDAIAAQHATMFFGVPTMYRRLADSPRAAEMVHLRLCVSGSAPLPADLHRAFEALTGQKVVERYGMTETCMLVSNPYDAERRPGTVGRPLPGLELRLDPKSNEVLVRGPNVFGGYLNRPDANADAFVDGWFRTGDIGELSDDGYLTLNGRAKELIISGGFNVYPREIEDELRRLPGVTDAAVTGTPDAEWGEVVTAWLTTDAPLDTDGVRAALADRLADYKQPRLVHLIEELPRNAMGKVQKHLLGHA